MTDHGFAPIGDEPSEDLPRTFRREKETRAREARERAEQERAAAPSLSTDPGPRYAAAAAPNLDTRPDVQPVMEDMPYSAAIRRFDVPFLHLVWFLMKAVVAGIPALLLLLAILWGIGNTLQLAFPDLIKMKILISFPN